MPQHEDCKWRARAHVSRCRAAICCGEYAASNSVSVQAGLGSAIAVDPSGSGPKLHETSSPCTDGGAKVPRSLTLPLRHTCANQCIH